MVSGEAYSIACINLFWRLWVELEQVSAAEDLAPRIRTELLRLEVVVLLDACRSERWRLKLDVLQRSTLQLIMEQVLDALNSAPELLPKAAIERAQDCLLDAVLGHCALVPAICVLRKSRTLHPHHAEALPAGRLHHDPAFETIHHSRAELLEA